jgi:peptidase E
MNLLALVFCLIFGHNKILDSGMGGRFAIHHTTCTQCQKKWFTKKLVSTHKIKFKKYEIKMRAQGQKIIIKTLQEGILLKKQKVNFYAL